MCTPGHQCLHISLCSRPLGFFFFPQGAIFQPSVLTQSLQKRSEPIIKNKLHLQKAASHLTFSSLGGDKTEVSTFLESAPCPLMDSGGPGQIPLRVTAFCSLQGPAAPSARPIHGHFLLSNVLQFCSVLFKQMLCFSCHSPILCNKGEQDI